MTSLPCAAPRAVVAGLLACCVTVPALPAAAAELRPATAEAFDRYVSSVEARRARELSAPGGFLGSDVGDPARATGVRREVLAGAVPVTCLAKPADGTGIEVPGGLIHHWRGTVFVPGVSLDEVLSELRQPAAGSHVQEDVLESRVLWRDGDRSRVFLKLVRRQIVTVTYDTEHDVRYVRLDGMRAWSRSASLKIAEVENAGASGEREKPVGRDRGFLWRLNSYWRYEQVPGGVLIELESVTLSRDIPSLVRPLARPIVNHIARESMTRTLETVRTRILSAASGGGRRPAGAR